VDLNAIPLGEEAASSRAERKALGEEKQAKRKRVKERSGSPT